MSVSHHIMPVNVQGISIFCGTVYLVKKEMQNTVILSGRQIILARIVSNGRCLTTRDCFVYFPINIQVQSVCLLCS